MGLLTDIIAYKLAYDKEKREAERAAGKEERERKADLQKKYLDMLAKDYEPFVSEPELAPPVTPLQEKAYQIAEEKFPRITPTEIKTIPRIPTEKDIMAGVPMEFKKRDYGTQYILDPKTGAVVPITTPTGEAITPKEKVIQPREFKPAKPEETSEERLKRLEAEAAARAKGVAGIRVETRRETDIAVADAKREVYTKDLESFLALDAQIPRGEGWGRFFSGIRTGVERIGQDTPRGQAAATYDAASKRLRVQLVRAAGDVGNINIVEQEAAEKIIPSIWDSNKVRELKIAYMKAIGDAIKSNQPNRIAEIFKNAGVGYTTGYPGYIGKPESEQLPAEPGVETITPRQQQTPPTKDIKSKYEGME